MKPLGSLKNASIEKNFKKSIDKRKGARLNGRSFQIQAYAWFWESSLKARKYFSEKIKFFKKSIDKPEGVRLNGRPFQIQKDNFWNFGKRGLTERSSFEKKTSSLKFTKYDCANLPKIFLAKNFE